MHWPNSYTIFSYWVGHNWIWIFRSVKTNLGRWKLVVAVISVDVYPFSGFLRLNLSPWGYGNRCFLVALCRLIVRRPNTGNRDQAASPWAGKNNGMVLLLCWARKCTPTAIPGHVDISQLPGCHFSQHMSSQWGSQKLLQSWCLMNLQSIFLILTYF